MNIQDWFPWDLTGWISLQSKVLSRVSSNTTVQKHQFFGAQLSLWSTSHPDMTTGKTIALTRQTFVRKVVSLLFNMLSKFIRAFLPRSKHLLTSWLQSSSAVILEPKKRKSVIFSTVSLSICYDWWNWLPWSLFFWMLSFKPAFSLSCFTFIKKLFSFSSISAIRVLSCTSLNLLICLPTILIPACASSSPAFHMMYFAYSLNKQSDNI